MVFGAVLGVEVAFKPARPKALESGEKRGKCGNTEGWMVGVGATVAEGGAVAS